MMDNSAKTKIYPINNDGEVSSDGIELPFTICPSARSRGNNVIDKFNGKYYILSFDNNIYETSDFITFTSVQNETNGFVGIASTNEMLFITRYSDSTLRCYDGTTWSNGSNSVGQSIKANKSRNNVVVLGSGEKSNGSSSLFIYENGSKSGTSKSLWDGSSYAHANGCLTETNGYCVVSSTYSGSSSSASSNKQLYNYVYTASGSIEFYKWSPQANVTFATVYYSPLLSRYFMFDNAQIWYKSSLPSYSVWTKKDISHKVVNSIQTQNIICPNGKMWGTINISSNLSNNYKVAYSMDGEVWTVDDSIVSEYYACYLKGGLST